MALLLRQMHLGPSHTNCLAIVEYPSPSSQAWHKSPHGTPRTMTAQSDRPPSSDQSSKNFLFQLPDEILVQILELAISGRDAEDRMHQKTVCHSRLARTLTRVCHRLRRLARPLLLRDVRIVYPNQVVPPSISVLNLHRTLRDRPHRRRHCRSLHMSLDDDIHPLGTYDIAKDLANMLTSLKKLSISAAFNGQFHDEAQGPAITHSWDTLMRMATNYKDLEEFTIAAGRSSFFVPALIERLDFHKLRVLEITCPHSCDDNSARLSPAQARKVRTAPFTTLRISGYRARPRSSALLLHWPAALTRLAFRDATARPELARYPLDYPMFETWLGVHRNSLTHIELGALSRPPTQRVFNATLFPNLVYLKLSRWQMPTPVRFAREHGDVLGPRLGTFVWGFEEFRESWSDFGDAEADWVAELARCAVSRGAALAKIEIHISPDAGWDVPEEMEYPWDRIDRVRDQVCVPNGLVLSYNQPVVTKEAWSRLARTRKSEIDADGVANEDVLDGEQSSSSGEHEGLEPESAPAYHGEDIRE